MSPDQIQSLTPSERSVLRKLLEERDQKTVARALGLSPETVKSHLRNAREKCGARDSFSLAKALAAHEGHPPIRVIPFDGGEQDGPQTVRSKPIEGIFETGRAQVTSSISEERSLFIFADGAGQRVNSEHEREASEGAKGGPRLLIAFGIVVLIMLILILAFPLSESFQRLANAIDPPTR